MDYKKSNMHRRQVAVINLGNTHATAAWVDDGNITGPVVTISVEELMLQSLQETVLAPYFQEFSLIACVVPALRAKIEMGCPGACFLNATMVDCEIVNFSRVDSSTLGSDRIANAVAAVSIVRPPVIVIDCGTAITIEVVDGRRCFIGGAIWPGRRLQRASLHLHTGQLPEVDIENTIPFFPAPNTPEAIRAGVDLGIVGAVREFVGRLQALPEWGHARVLLTGGDGPFFTPLITGAELMSEKFTLQGLAVVAEQLWL